MQDVGKVHNDLPAITGQSWQMARDIWERAIHFLPGRQGRTLRNQFCN